MNITITRDVSTDSGTPGDLVATSDTGSTFHCKTLELPWRNNQTGLSCICPGDYSAEVSMSDHFQCNVIRLEDKNGRTNCLIHYGNFAGDVTLGLMTDVHGCTLVGNGFGLLNNKHGDSQNSILCSRVTFDALMNFIENVDSITVTYQWKDGCAPITGFV